MAEKVVTGDLAMSESLRKGIEQGYLKSMRTVGKGEHIHAVEFSGVIPGAKGEPFSHHNEQITIVTKGKVLMTVDEKETVLCAGDSIFIPSNAVHYGETLEESTIIDIFSPPRDYLD